MIWQVVIGLCGPVTASVEAVVGKNIEAAKKVGLAGSSITDVKKVYADRILGGSRGNSGIVFHYISPTLSW